MRFIAALEERIFPPRKQERLNVLFEQVRHT
jgi:hypothetical protein